MPTRSSPRSGSTPRRLWRTRPPAPPAEPRENGHFSSRPPRIGASAARGGWRAAHPRLGRLAGPPAADPRAPTGARGPPGRRAEGRDRAETRPIQSDEGRWPTGGRPAPVASWPGQGPRGGATGSQGGTSSWWAGAPGASAPPARARPTGRVRSTLARPTLSRPIDRGRRRPGRGRGGRGTGRGSTGAGPPHGSTGADAPNRSHRRRSATGPSFPDPASRATEAPLEGPGRLPTGRGPEGFDQGTGGARSTGPAGSLPPRSAAEGSADPRGGARPVDWG